MNQKDKNRQSDRCTIAIIGGGFTGSILAAQLLRGADASLSVVLIELRALLGRGLAYSTSCEHHLLNVPAENMSALADDPLHFLRWAQHGFDNRAKACDFLPRRVYGEYVESVLRQEIRAHPGQFEWRHDEACSITRGDNTARIVLGSGEVVHANKVVLALGNFPASNPLLQGREQPHKRYINDIWAADTQERLARCRSILLIGSGLTSADAVVATWELGFTGTIHILSRHGFLPTGHKATAGCTAVREVENFPCTTLGLVRWVRALVEEAQVQGCDWRPVIDALRPRTQRIWQALPRKEQRRFLRHVRPYWEVHRHRLAPKIDGLLASQLRSGQLQIHAGRITAYHENADSAEIAYRDRKSGKLQRLNVDWVLNCTGPEPNCAAVRSALLKNLLRQRLARPGPLSLGLDVSERCAVVDGHGMVSNFMYAIGPLCKGNLWETTAVPEIREQISELASLLLASCFQKNSTLRDFGAITVTREAPVEAWR